MTINSFKYSQKTIGFIFFFFILFLFVTQLTLINKQPLQPWDEGLYAVRVKYIVETNHWLDQTAGSVDGLYSSSQPPLQIWLSAATAKITGLNLFSLRIWPLLFSLGTLLLVFYFFEDKKYGLVAALLLGTIPFYAAYSRLGQLDMAFVFFYTAGLFFRNKYLKKSDKWFLLLTGIMAGLSFMAKMWMGVILLLSVSTHVLYLMIRYKKQIKQAVAELTLILLPVLIIALPWQLWMYAKYGNDFLSYFFSFHVVQRVVSGVEHNTVALGPLFYFNQLLVMMSAAWLFIFLSLLKKKKLNRQEVLLWIFTLTPMLIFTLSSTKLRSYSLPMLPSLAMLTALSFHRISEQKKLPFWFVPAVIFICIWSSSQFFRDQV